MEMTTQQAPKTMQFKVGLILVSTIGFLLPALHGAWRLWPGQLAFSDRTTFKNATDFHAKTISNDEFLEHLYRSHPQCSPGILDPESKGQLDIEKLGKYVRVNKDVDFPRYDHLSCFVMKPRYNCAKPSGDESAKATDWKFVLQSSVNTSSTSHEANSIPHCDIRAFVDAAGGPTGVAKRGLSFSALQQQQQRSSDKPMRSVYIQGNSYMRQIFEALTCAFQDQITDIRLQEGGPIMSKAAFKARDGALFQRHELGKIVGKDDEVSRKGCHEGDLTQFYAPNVTIPSTIKGCNDNLAMVEFGHSFRFYYIFRSSWYENMTDAYTFVDMDVDSLDVFLWNDDAQIIKERSKQTKHAMWTENLSSLLGKLKIIQKKDSGVYFGADNPWITHPPDNHPCMPGIPDDEVNLLLFMLMTGYHFN
jgi:hypothetical protein